ncbi:unnamed protein product, partial [Ectocarpus fasciculatus]
QPDSAVVPEGHPALGGPRRQREAKPLQRNGRPPQGNGGDQQVPQLAHRRVRVHLQQELAHPLPKLEAHVPAAARPLRRRQDP